MDAFSLHLQPLERRYPSELQVAHIGNMPEKSHFVDMERPCNLEMRGRVTFSQFLRLLCLLVK